MSTNLPKTRDIVSGAFAMVKEYGKVASDLPLDDDYDYHMAFSGFNRLIKHHSKSLIEVMDKCCQLLPARRQVRLQDDGSGVLTDSQRAAVMEAVDSLLENVAGLLDDLKGRRLSAKDQLSVTFGSELNAPSSSAAAASGGHVLRPQMTFKTPVDNSSKPFRPVYYDERGEQHLGQPGVHPFADLIRNTPIPDAQLLPCAETPYLPLSTCPLRFVDSVEDLQDLVSGLLEVNEIAVDLEHHDIYSYLGFTCLMQISTRTEDILIDCLKLRSSMHLLVPVFLNPRILKVFHGAREDVRWLQKDFGLYIVNFFDTSIALQALHMPHSLAFAVDHFCQVRLNKKYQTADWRVRPIPGEMVAYARQDTHFLLYVYDRLKALLLNSAGRASVGNLLVHVFNESRRLSLELYEKPQLDPNASYKLALGRSLGGLSPSQLQVARDVFNWRDAAAREVDDSPAAVMQLSAVLAIATKLPVSASDMLKCCFPVSVVVRTNVMKLVQITKDALGTTTEPQRQQKEEDDVKVELSKHKAVEEPLRPVGVHRPSTGTLPSIEHRVSTAPPLGDAAVVVNTEPSAWFSALRGLSDILRGRSAPSVALPGHVVVAAMAQAKIAQKQQCTAVEAMTTTTHQAVDTMSAAVSGVVSSPVNSGDLLEEKRDDIKSEEDKNGNFVEKRNLDVMLEASTATSEQAFAIRQQYGTGSKNRKKMKNEKSYRKKVA